MEEFKYLIGLFAISLTFFGYVTYVRDIIHGKTKPHLFSWFLWALVSFIAFALQVYGGAGIGAYVTLAAVIMCLVVIILGVKYKSTSTVTRVDVLFLLAAFVAIGFWLFAKQPVISAVLITLIDLLAFAPTVRKSWNSHIKRPYHFMSLIRYDLVWLPFH